MNLRYGNYTHERDEVWVSLTKTVIENSAKIGIGNTFRWEISGRLKGTDQDDLTAKIIALELAYGVNGQDLILFQNDGTTISAHSMFNADTSDGVKVKSISYPVGNNAEYSTYRNYVIVVEGDIYFDPNVNLSLTFSETIQQIGTGGPIFRMIPTLSKPPVRQVVADFSSIRVTQNGQATSNLDFVPEPPPISPESEHQERRVVSKTVQDTTFVTSWRYEMEVATPPGPFF